jgi:hypothetical protein
MMAAGLSYEHIALPAAAYRVTVVFNM